MTPAPFKVQSSTLEVRRSAPDRRIAANSARGQDRYLADIAARAHERFRSAARIRDIDPWLADRIIAAARDHVASYRFYRRQILVLPLPVYFCFLLSAFCFPP